MMCGKCINDDPINVVVVSVQIVVVHLDVLDDEFMQSNSKIQFDKVFQKRASQIAMYPGDEC